YSSRCSAKDSWLMAIFTFGEGYHNYHHEFQYDYRNGVKWWQWDPTKWTIWTLEKLGMVRGLRRVPEEKILLAQLAETRRRISERVALPPHALSFRLLEMLQASHNRLHELGERWGDLRADYASRADAQIESLRAALAELRREIRHAVDLLALVPAPVYSQT